MNKGMKAEEFLYSKSNIYIERFYNNRVWDKTPYKLSSDGNEMTFGWREYQLKKITVEWKKEDIIGLWYEKYESNYSPRFTFTENSLVIHEYGEDNHAKITLTDEYFSGLLKFSMFQDTQKKSTCYYYIIDNKLLLSNGNILFRKTDSEQ